MLTPHSNGESVVISYGITAAKIQQFFKPPKYFKKKSKKMNTIQKMQKPDISPESVFFPIFAGCFQWLHLPRCKGTKDFTFRKKNLFLSRKVHDFAPIGRLFLHCTWGPIFKETHYLLLVVTLPLL